MIGKPHDAKKDLTPGPGAYVVNDAASPTRFRNQTFAMTKQARFKDRSEKSPGPGQYRTGNDLADGK